VVERPPFAARSAFAGLLVPVGVLPAEVIVRERASLVFAMIEARKGRADALTDRCASLFGVTPPAGPRSASQGGLTFLGLGPARWLVVGDELRIDLPDELTDRLHELAFVIDQSDGLAALRVTGSKARATFAKGLPVDLNPEAFGRDAVASSAIAHMGVTIWRAEGEDAFDIVLYRSLAASFWHWLSRSAAEFGLVVE
jgi:methylglutamate dehydrogenase subunit D